MARAVIFGRVGFPEKLSSSMYEPLEFKILALSVSSFFKTCFELYRLLLMLTLQRFGTLTVVVAGKSGFLYLSFKGPLVPVRLDCALYRMLSLYLVMRFFIDYRVSLNKSSIISGCTLARISFDLRPSKEIGVVGILFFW